MFVTPVRNFYCAYATVQQTTSGSLFQGLPIFRRLQPSSLVDLRRTAIYLRSEMKKVILEI